GAGEIRAGDQPQDRQSTWPRSTADATGTRRRGDRVDRQRRLVAHTVDARPSATRRWLQFMVPHPADGRTTDASQLNFRLAALVKARIEPISRLICASKAAGVIGIGSMPCCASFSRTPGAASAVCVSWASLSTISRDVLAGTNSPVQNV